MNKVYCMLLFVLPLWTIILGESLVADAPNFQDNIITVEFPDGILITNVKLKVTTKNKSTLVPPSLKNITEGENTSRLISGESAERDTDAVGK